jgi:hypothetical protein
MEGGGKPPFMGGFHPHLKMDIDGPPERSSGKQDVVLGGVGMCQWRLLF